MSTENYAKLGGKGTLFKLKNKTQSQKINKHKRDMSVISFKSMGSLLPKNKI